MEVLYAALALGGMGILFGGVLTFTSKIFAVPSNPLRDSIREILPGANCGGCGYPGCDGCADAMAAGKAAPNACPVGGPELAEQVAALLGTDAGEANVKMVAHLICQGDIDRCKNKFNYVGIQDCVAATLVSDGSRACKYGCLGLGTCVRACPFDAIHVDERLQLVVVDPDKCTGCGKCVSSCPKHVLKMQPVDLPVRLLCRAAEKGVRVSDNCRVGCIGCELCMEACHFDVITMQDHLPVFDMNKCVGCMMCAEVCPTSAIWADWDNRKIAEIEQSKCIGCGMCKRQCHFESILGDRKKPHTITAACTGCGACVAKCPTKCITMKVREHARDNFAKVGTTPSAVPVFARNETAPAPTQPSAQN